MSNILLCFPNFFLRLSKDAYGSKFYLAHCRLASHCVDAGHEMISPSLPISLVTKLGHKRQGQAVWLDPSAEHSQVVPEAGQAEQSVLVRSVLTGCEGRWGRSHGRVYALWCDYMDEKNWTPIRNSSKEPGRGVIGLRNWFWQQKQSLLAVTSTISMLLLFI